MLKQYSRILTAGMMAQERKKEDTCGNAGGTSPSACAKNSAVQKLCGLKEDSKWRREGLAKKKLEENGIGASWIRHLKPVFGYLAVD